MGRSAPQRTQLPRGQDHHLIVVVLTWTTGGLRSGLPLTCLGSPLPCLGSPLTCLGSPLTCWCCGSVAVSPRRRRVGHPQGSSPAPYSRPLAGGQTARPSGRCLVVLVDLLVVVGDPHHHHRHHCSSRHVVRDLGPGKGPENGCLAGTPAAAWTGLSGAPPAMHCCWACFGIGVVGCGPSLLHWIVVDWLLGLR